jgi:hypothetical protein
LPPERYSLLTADWRSYLKLDEIIEQWSIDSKIDPFNLGNESIAIAQLHHKYYQMYLIEKATYFSLEKQYKKLKLQKYEFYTQGPSKQSDQFNWQLPPIGKVLKNEVNMYIEADDDLLELDTRIKFQLEKVSYIESIIKSLTNRGFQIKSAIEYERFKMGSL